MIDDDVKHEFEKLNARLERVEQFLPSVAAKADVVRVATKADLEQFATRADLERFATRADLERFATQVDLQRYPTRVEVQAAIRDEGERTRRHFDVVAEAMRDDLRLVLEANMAIVSRVETLEHHRDVIDRRVDALEGRRPPRRR